MTDNECTCDRLAHPCDVHDAEDYPVEFRGSGSHTHCTAGVGCDGWDEDCDDCADCVVCHPLTALPRGPFPAPEPPYIPVGGNEELVRGLPRGPLLSQHAPVVTRGVLTEEDTDGRA